MYSRIRISAKSALCGAYGKVLPVFSAILAVFVIFSLSNRVFNRFFGETNEGILAAVAVAGLPLFVAMISPLRLLMQMKHLFLAKGARYCVKPQISFEEGLKACDLSVRLFFRKLFWLGVFEVIPVCLWLVFLYQIKVSDVSVKAAITVTSGLSLLAVAGLFFWLIFIQRYSESLFFLACYKDFTAADAIKESIRKTKNCAAKIFFFKSGFLPWFLLCLLVFPVFYVVPYYKQSVTCLFLGR